MAFTLRLTDEQEKELTRIAEVYRYKQKSDGIKIAINQHLALKDRLKALENQIIKLEKQKQAHQDLKETLKKCFSDIMN